MVIKVIDGDWAFGQYLTKKNEIAQNITTRIKSWANDWFLDDRANIDWGALLGSTNPRAKEMIKAEVIRVTRNTKGVTIVNDVQLDFDRVTRELKIILKYTNIYGKNNLEIKIDNY
jgi:hypothetical protein